MLSTGSESLDGAWRFIPDHDGKERLISVPGCWQAQFPELREYAGRAVYSREFTVPPVCSGQCIRLRFGAVDYFARVRVNGEIVGEHEGGFTPFEMDISRFIRFGEPNTLEVEVLDPGLDKPCGPFKFEEIPHGKQSWYGNISGIWQSVRLEITDHRRITSLKVTPKPDLSGASVEVGVNTPEGGEIRLRCSGPTRVPEIEALIGPCDGAATIELPTPDALAWSPDFPNLYCLTAELAVRGEVVHSAETTFGLRTIEARDGRILLNGRPIYIRGALDQDFYPHTMYSPPSKQYLLDQFQAAKRVGLNLLRCHIKVPDPIYLEAADEVGLLVWYEIPNWGVLADETRARARETLCAMLERDHNHPSLVIVSIINEGWGIHCDDADHRKWLIEMYDYAKRLDPTRLVVDNSPCGGNFHVKTDINDFHCYFSIPDHADECVRWVKEFSQRPKWAFSPHGDSQETGNEPLIVSEFGNWGLPSVTRLRSCYGGEDPWWFKTGKDAARPEGVEERFKNQNLTRVFGTFDELSRASQSLQAQALKFEIEQMRLLPEIQGYVITEFTDLHWESNGLFDMCRNPKIVCESSAEFQAPNVVVLRDGFVKVRGRKCSFVPIAASSEPLPEKCVLSWEAAGASGSVPMNDNRGEEITFEVPASTEPQKHVLSLRLSDPQGAVLSANSYVFHIYPDSLRSGNVELAFSTGAADLGDSLRSRGWTVTDSGGDVLICDALGDKAKAFLETGKPVLFLANKAAENGMPQGLQIEDRSKMGRWGDWCSSQIWFAKRPPFSRAPYGGLFDLSLKEAAPACVITGVDVASEDVLAGIFVGWLRAEAAIAVQARCARGRLFVTTLGLGRSFEQGSSAAFLQDEVIEHVLSPEFAPALLF